MNIISKYKNIIKTFLNKNITSPYLIVSLGVNCYAKTFLTRYKFKKKKEAGELTLPFDYTFYTNAKYITEFIQNDFNEYFEEIYFVKESNYWGKARKIFFSHETKFGENDKDKLIAMYSKRIRNFYSVFKTQKPVLFLQVLTDKKIGEDIENLYCTLKEKVKVPFVLAVVDCDDVIQKKLPEYINVLKVKKPYQDYDFYSPECYKTKEAQKFEKQIEKFVENIIISKMKLKVTKYF